MNRIFIAMLRVSASRARLTLALLHGYMRIIRN